MHSARVVEPHTIHSLQFTGARRRKKEPGTDTRAREQSRYRLLMMLYLVIGAIVDLNLAAGMQDDRKIASRIHAYHAPTTPRQMWPTEAA